MFYPEAHLEFVLHHIPAYTDCLSPTNPLHFLLTRGKASAAASFAVAARHHVVLKATETGEGERHECLPKTLVHTSRRPGEITK